MRTLGIDLASAAEKTAWCLLEWSGGAASVVDDRTIEPGDLERI